MKLRAWDCETGTLPALGRKASPFNPLNHVVMTAWTDSDMGQGFVMKHWPTKEADGWFTEVLAGVDLLVGFNIKFDVLYATRPGYDQNRAAWRRWIAGGGRLWDCQIAEYLICGAGPEHQWLSMDEVAPRYGGSVKIDEVKLLWNKGVDTKDIDPELLKQYLCGRIVNDAWEPGDIHNTLLIAEAQIKQAKADGIYRKILACDMAALVALIEMERNGEQVDVQRGRERAGVLRDTVTEQQALLQKYVEGYPGTFSWRSRFHKSALFFGGNVKYEAPEFQNKAGEWQLHKPWPEGQQAYSQMDVKVQTGEVYKSGKNAGLPKTRTEKVDDPSKIKTRKGTALYAFPQQVDPDPEWESSDEGVFSTNAEVIAEIKDRRLDVPFLQDYILLNDVLKDLSTYYITGEPGEETGMLTLVDDSGQVHCNFSTCGTATTRLAVDSPNLSNLPRATSAEGEYVSEVKHLFISRFKGGKRGQFDFSSLEIYVGGFLTKSKQLLADLKAGLDMHMVRASGAHAVPYEQAMIEFHGEGKALWKERRQTAKITGFRKQYGAGAESTAKHLRLPLEVIQSIYDAEAARYPEIDAFNEAVQAAVEASAEPTGKAIPHPSLQCAGVIVPIMRGQWRGPDGQLFTFRSGPASPHSVRRGKRTSFKPTEIKNYPTQGTGASFMKAALGVAVKEIYRREELWDTVLLTTTVHDSVTSDLHPDFVDEGMALLGNAMTRASGIMKALGVYVPFPVPAEGEVGDSLGALSAWKAA